MVPVTFLFRQGNNTSLVAHEDGRTVTAHDAQLTPSEEQRPTRQRNPVRRYPDVDPSQEGGCCAAIAQTELNSSQVALRIYSD